MFIFDKSNICEVQEQVKFCGCLKVSRNDSRYLVFSLFVTNYLLKIQLPYSVEFV